MGRAFRGTAVLVAAMAVAAMGAASAFGATGEITRAVATPDWAQANIAGSVTWTGCEHAVAPPQQPKPGPQEPPGEEEESAPVDPTPPPPSYCGWTPFLTVAPGTEPSECASPARQWPDKLGPGVLLAWEGGESRANGSAGFEAGDVPIEGEGSQLACLSVVEIAPVYSQVMVACTPADPDCSPFSYQEVPFSLPLASAFLRPPVKKPSVRPRQSQRCRGRHRHHRICISQHRKVP